MNNTTDIDGIPDLLRAPVGPELDSTFGAIPILEQFDGPTPYQTLDDDLAEVPQAFAAYLDHQQNQWG